MGLSAILTAASGRPFSPLAGPISTATATVARSRRIARVRDPPDPTSSVGRNSETTEAIVNVDLRVSKGISFGDQMTLELILDVFNLFNRVNFIEDTNQSSFAIFGAGAYPTAASPTYGRYTLRTRRGRCSLPRKSPSEVGHMRWRWHRHRTALNTRAAASGDEHSSLATRAMLMICWSCLSAAE